MSRWTGPRALALAALALLAHAAGARAGAPRWLESVAVPAGRLAGPAAAGRVAVPMTHYPPGPGSCTDSLKIFNVQFASASCHPVPGDTLFGVGGIVTAIDASSTSYGFYLQNNASGSNGAPWTGLFVGTGANSLAAKAAIGVGDSVVVEWCRVIEYQGGTELYAPNLSTVYPNLIVRKVASGYPIPAVHVGTTSELKEPSSNASAEPWEGCLVQINGPLRVVRAFPPPAGGITNSFLVVSEAACPNGSGGPCDSVLVDGSALTTFGPPPLGTLVDTLRGVLEQRTSPGYSAGAYRVQPRAASDVVVAAPPNVIDAFSVYDNDAPSGGGRIDSVMVVFDRPLEPFSAGYSGNYHASPSGTVVSATLLPAPNDNRVLLRIENGLGDGDLATLYVYGVASLSGGVPMPVSQSLAFIDGVLTPSQVAGPSLNGLTPSPCDDRSPFAGTGSTLGPRLAVRGTVTGLLGPSYGFLQLGADRRDGLVFWAPIAATIPGHDVLLVGNVVEDYSDTEEFCAAYMRDYGTAPIPTPIAEGVPILVDATCDSLQTLVTGEDFEGVLVRVSRVRITKSQPAGATFNVVQPSASLLDTLGVYGIAGNFSFVPDSGHVVDLVGVLVDLGGYFGLIPRSNADITDAGGGAAFATPIDISRSGASSRDPEILRETGGHLFTAWGQEFLRDAYSVSLDDGANWSPFKGAPRQGRHPALALADSNKIAVLGAGLDSLRLHQSLDAGIHLQAVTATVDGFPTDRPSLATGSTAHLHAAWERSGIGVLYARSFDNGASFGATSPLGIDAGPSERHSMVRICATRGDTVYVVWEYHRNSGPPNNRILFSRSLNGGTTFSPAKVISDTTRIAYLGDAHADTTGAIDVMWSISGSPDSLAFVRSSSAGGTFTTVGYLTPPATTGLCPKTFVLGPGNHVHAVVGTCGTDLYYLHSSSGGASWDAPVNFTNAMGPITDPWGVRITLDRLGVPVIVWSATRGTGSSEIFFTRRIN